MVWMMAHDDSDWTVVVTNICKEHKKCAIISKILVCEVADVIILGNLYASVIHSVLLFGS